MALIQGKQLQDGAITTSKIAPNAVTSAKVDSSVLVSSGANPLTGSLNAANNFIVGLLDPVNPQDAATKNYVDTAVQGLDLKNSCRAGTTAALPANTRSSNVITANANGAFPAQDGVTLTANDPTGNSLLVKDEATAANNGIYYLSNAGSAGTPWTLTRRTDASLTADVTAGMFTFITEGATQADTGWVLTTPDPVTLNTTSLNFTQFSGAGTVMAGNGLNKVGNTINVVMGATSGGITSNPGELDINYAIAGNLAADDASVASAGTSQLLPRADHKHQVSTAAPSVTLTIGSSSATGSAATLLRSDTTFTIPAPAAPANVDHNAASAGVSTNFARQDHKHDVNVAAPVAGAVAVGNSASAGTALTLSLSDHIHQVSAATPVAVGAANATGSAITFVRSDHVHAAPHPTTANKSMSANTTASDGDPATATTVTNPNALGSYIAVTVNGISYRVGDGTKISVDCYLSGDGGVTARAMSAVIAGDTLRWNGSVAGFQLATTDVIDIDMMAF